MKQEELIAAAESMIGTPFHAQGRKPGVGLDCIGMVACAARQSGFLFQDQTAYPMRPNGALQPVLEHYLTRIEASELHPGDVLLMAFSGMEPHHVALYVGEGQIIHAYTQARKTVKQTYSKYWQEKTVAVYRFPGIE